MEKIIAAVIKAFPGMLAAWVYPWIAKPLLLPYVGGIPDPRFIGEKLVEAFTSPPAAVDPLTVSGSTLAGGEVNASTSFSPMNRGSGIPPT